VDDGRYTHMMIETRNPKHERKRRKIDVGISET
jgi:hypothetical protein